MDNKTKMISMGIDYDAVMRRFANQEELFMKFLIKFCEDTSFSLLMKAFQERKLDVIEATAHTMKGTTANLGLTELSNACNTLVVHIRAHEDFSILTKDLEEIIVDYEKIIAALTQEEGTDDGTN